VYPWGFFFGKKRVTKREFVTTLEKKEEENRALCKGGQEKKSTQKGGDEASWGGICRCLSIKKRERCSRKGLKKGSRL